ncbi:aminoglycoside phosphotransferase family protein [Paenibacillus sp. FSL W8-0187]|uniref:aminoglycoside phosphotransferase family protein n=1 Tax=Paenibacillus sp. FSL W8-0187 TaxID=2921710 RepID=UPI0030DDAEE7
MANDILLSKFQNIKLTALSGGYTNSTLLLEGSDPPVIAKIFKKNSIDARTEINSLTILNNSGVSPAIYDYFEDNESLYIIMDYIHGVNSQIFLDNGDIDKVREIYKLLGFRLANDIHSIKRRGSGLHFPGIDLINVDIDSFDFVPSSLKDEVKRVLSISVNEEETLIHGDFGPHNTIFSNDSLFVIDWEWAGWGNPLQDVAWVVWFVHLHYPHVCKELSENFLRTYNFYSNVLIT